MFTMAQMGQAMMRHDEIMNQIPLERSDEGGSARLERHAIVDSGIVDQAVQAGEFGQGSADRVGARGLVAQIQFEIARLRLQRRQTAPELGSRRVAIENYRDRSLLGQQQADGPSDAARAAGDDDDMILEFQIHEPAPKLPLAGAADGKA